MRLDKEMGMMNKLDELKHIRRELHVISDVVTHQENVISQMFEALEDGEFKFVEASNKFRTRWLEKLERRKKLIDDLGRKAGNIFNNVRIPKSD